MSGYLLVVNVGSTSIKSRLFAADLQAKAVLTADYGIAAGLVVEGQDIYGELIDQYIAATHDANAALTVVLTQWRQTIAANSLSLAAIGHRIVHGASWFDTVTPITDSVLERLVQLDHYAPLHNPFNRLDITMAAEFFPDTAQY